MSHIIKKTLAKNNIAEVILAEYADDIHSCNVLVKTAFLDIKDTALVRLNAAKHLNHPGMLDIIDFGVCTNSKPKKHYISTRYIPGVTLTQVLSKFESLDRKVPLSLVMHVITSLCNSLEIIHDFYGNKKDKELLFHGAICPDNVFITFDGDVCFTDSGIADMLKYRFTGEKIIENGRIVFHHPDVTMGSSVKRHHEIYSMGILLFRMLIEESSFIRFFEGDGIKNLKNVKKLIPSIPDAVEKIIDRATRFRGLSKFAKYEQITDVYHDLLDFAIASSVKYEKEITSLILYALFPDSRDHSSEKHEIQLRNALEYVKNGKDSSLRSFLSERFCIDEKTCTIYDQYQILNLNVSADLSQKAYFPVQTIQNESKEFSPGTLRETPVPDPEQNIILPAVPVYNHIKEIIGNTGIKTVEQKYKAENKKEKKNYSFTGMQPVKVILPEKSLQAFSKIIKDRSVFDAQIVDLPDHNANNMNQQKKNEIKTSTLDSFAILQQKNGSSNRENIIEAFSNILKKENVSA
jgi:hypothetical protein